jgi:hypothetical protein
MQYEEFIKKVKELSSVLRPNKTKLCYSDQYAWRTDYTIQQRWVSGGTSGGSCWDVGPVTYHSVEGERAPTSWPKFDSIIEAFWPDISFLVHRRVIQPLVQSRIYCEDEYYGNSTTYSYNVVNLRELFTVLQEHGKIQHT